MSTEEVSRFTNIDECISEGSLHIEKKSFVRVSNQVSVLSSHSEMCIIFPVIYQSVKIGWAPL